MARQLNALIVSNFIAGPGAKERNPVRVISLTNVNLAADLDASTIDGVLVSAGDRVALAGQTTGSQNGIYEIGSGVGATFRAPDAQEGDDISYSFFSVKTGTHAETCWQSIAIEDVGVIGTGDLNLRMVHRPPQAVGELLYADSTRTFAALPKPSIPSVLQMDSAGTPIWLDKTSLSSGIDAKDSVRVDTPAAITATYAPTGGSLGTGIFTDLDLTILADYGLSSGTINVDDRILFRSQTDPKQNGIYRVTIAGASGAAERAADFYNAATISGGAFVFVENTSTGWVLQGTGALTPNTDDINWVQFTAANFYTGGNGIQISSNTISAKLLANSGLEFDIDGKIALNLGASAINGTLAVADGGTGATSLASGALLVGAGTSAVSTLAPTNYRTTVVDGTGAFTLSNTIYGTSFRNGSNELGFTTTPGAAQTYWVDLESSATDAIINVAGSTAGSLVFKTKGEYDFRGTTTAPATLKLGEQNGLNYVALAAPASLSGDKIYTLPATDGSNGDFLKTDGSGVMSWSSLATSVPRDVQLLADAVNVNTLLTTICFFPWLIARYGSSVSAKIQLEAVFSSPVTLAVTISDDTAVSVLATTTYTTGGFKTLSFTAPASDARISISVQKAGSGTNPVIYGITLNIL